MHVIRSPVIFETLLYHSIEVLLIKDANPSTIPKAWYTQEIEKQQGSIMKLNSG